MFIETLLITWLIVVFALIVSVVFISETIIIVWLVIAVTIIVLVVIKTLANLLDIHC